MTKRLGSIISLIVFLVVQVIATFGGIALAAPDAKQYQYHIQLEGISAVQLSWWFQHIADEDGVYWKPLSSSNKNICWVVTPSEDAHQIIGSLFECDQKVSKDFSTNDFLHMQIQYADYITQSRQADGAPTPLMPSIGVPADYSAPYPSPIGVGDFGQPPATSDNNGFNEDMLFFDGNGFCPGRILWSWKNTGNDDTTATASNPYSIDLYCTFYLPYMEDANRPPEMLADGYFFTEKQTTAIWGIWKEMLLNMPTILPDWFNKNTQDDIARSKGWTVTAVIDTGVLAGANSEMEVWWWMHGMGDAPGNAYVFWHPIYHHTIRWLPGYSPTEVAKKNGLTEVPTDRVLPGIIYPDLQGDNLVQDGGGMMAYPTSMSPVPGVYKTLNPMMIVTKQQVDAWEAGTGPRFPEPFMWLLHQWEDVSGGLVHRSTVLAKLPLQGPVTQACFYSEHQMQEGLFKGLGYLPRLYNAWLKTQKNN